MIVGWIKRFGLWLGLLVSIFGLAGIFAKMHLAEGDIADLKRSDSAQNQMILTLGLQDCPIETSLATNYERLTEYIINHCNGGEIWKVSE